MNHDFPDAPDRTMTLERLIKAPRSAGGEHRLYAALGRKWPQTCRFPGPAGRGGGRNPGDDAHGFHHRSGISGSKRVWCRGAGPADAGQTGTLHSVALTHATIITGEGQCDEQQDRAPLALVGEG